MKNKTKTVSKNYSQKTNSRMKTKQKTKQKAKQTPKASPETETIEARDAELGNLYKSMKKQKNIIDGLQETPTPHIINLNKIINTNMELLKERINNLKEHINRIWQVMLAGFALITGIIFYSSNNINNRIDRVEKRSIERDNQINKKLDQILTEIKIK